MGVNVGHGSVTRNNYRAPSLIIQIMVPQVEFRDFSFLNMSSNCLVNCRSGRLIVFNNIVEGAARSTTPGSKMTTAPHHGVAAGLCPGQLEN